jgi:hypothetical protein
MPKLLTLAQVRDIVARQALSEFIDVLENEVIDFKGEPYRLNTDQEKAELAKDITALANTSGGYIILGIKTTKLPTYNADIAHELRPIPKELLQPEQYQSVAKDWIYPPIHQLRVQFVPTDSDPERGLIALEIPESLTTDKPFIMTKIADGARKERRILFGYAERFESRSMPAVVQRLQQLLHLGLGVGTRMERMEEVLLRKATDRDVAAKGERQKRFSERLRRAEIDGLMTERLCQKKA